MTDIEVTRPASSTSGASGSGDVVTLWLKRRGDQGPVSAALRWSVYWQDQEGCRIVVGSCAYLNVSWLAGIMRITR